ncbi:MAG TPA: ABC transporter ATP-binding protein, partial [Jatrophihabitantaceae bacterium]
YAWRSLPRSRDGAGRKVPRGTWRRIVRFAAPYRGYLIVFLLIIIADSLIGVATPVLAGKVVNDITRQVAAHVVVWTAVLIAALAVVDAALSFAQRWYSARIGEGLIYDMRVAVFSHIQRMPLAFFTRTQTGALVSRLNNDVLGAQQAFTSTLSGLVSNVVSLALTAGVMFTLSWQITLLSLIMLPVFVLPARRIGHRLQDITRESYNLNASMNATMTERFNVAGALLVKLFGRSADEAESFRSRADRVRDIGVTSAMYGRAFFVALTLVAALAQALVYGLGGYYAITGRLSTGTVVTLALLLTRLYGPLTALSNARVDVMSALVSFDRVFEVLDLNPSIDDAPDAIELPADARTIEFDDVRFGYPTAAEVSLASLEDVAVLDQTSSQEVLHGVSFRAEAGQMVALVGPSGAGKTTISQLVPRIYDVRSGAVRVGGHDVRTVTQASLREVIGVVSQEAHMFHDSIRANLRYAAPDASDDELRHAVDAAQLGALISSLPDGLDTVVGDRGYRLSGGEKARLAIA